VLDIPGGHGKAVIAAASIAEDGEGGHLVTDFRGGTHRYAPCS
jgi:lysine 2,3-aminomutase